MSKSNTFSIVLVGCGNIGVRHLEGLLKLDKKISISIVEPNLTTQKSVQSYLSKFEYDEISHTINWYDSVKQLDSFSDLTIVATTSIDRVDLIEKLLEKGHLRFLIEKIVCQSDTEYKQLLLNLEKYGAKGWINTNRRYFSFYQKIKPFFSSEYPITMKVTAGNKGLGSNALHYVDLFNWFIENTSTKLDGSKLHKKIFPNKRNPQLMEFAGIINGINGKSNLIISFFPNDNSSIIVEIFNKENCISIDEITENIISSQGFFSDLAFEYEHVSSLTTKITNDILTNDICLLPSAEELYFIHKEIFQIFNTHIKRIRNEDTKLCPIT